MIYQKTANTSDGIIMRHIMALTISISIILLSFGPSYANGHSGLSHHCYSSWSQNGLLEYDDINVIRDEVELRYLHALDISLSRSAIYSQSSIFTWAIDAKVNCAKALGYLKRRLIWRPVLNIEAIQKCDCAYSRMMNYLR